MRRMLALAAFLTTLTVFAHPTQRVDAASSPANVEQAYSPSAGPSAEVAALIDERAAYRGASAWQITIIVSCESGWNRFAVGAAGELGPVQLHPRGKLPEFYALGYTDPFDWSESIDYLAWALARGQQSHWTTAHYPRPCA